MKAKIITTGIEIEVEYLGKLGVDKIYKDLKTGEEFVEDDLDFTCEKKLFALTFCYEGVDDNMPYAQTIAISEDKEKLIEEMKKCVKEDLLTDEEDEWNDDRNFKIYKEEHLKTILQHKARINLFTHYVIRTVKMI